MVCITCIISDNCSTSKKVAELFGVPMLGWASHKLNLAVGEFCSEFSDIIDRIHALMVRLRQLKMVGKLRALTNLSPVLRAPTRWSCVYNMLSRYVEIKHFISQVFGNENLHDMLLTPIQEKNATSLLTKLKIFNSTCIELQANSTTITDVRYLFDLILEKFPETVRYSGHHGVKTIISKTPLSKFRMVKPVN